jgi:flagella basal body P-ring formation protein FlgA
MRDLLHKSFERARRGLGAAAAVIALACAATAQAGQLVALREEPTSGAVVTLGDLFDGAGPVASTLVGYGAPIGLSAVLDAGEVQRIAHSHGLDWNNPSGLRRIEVRRDAGPRAAASAPVGRSDNVLVYARNMAAGDVIEAQDLVYGPILASTAPSDMPRDAEAVIGKMVRRPMRAGTPAALHDIATAQVIKRDDPVQVVYRSDGISLTLHGTAMGPAAVGDTVGVMNTLSKKVIQAIAIGPDQAVIGPAADEIRQAAATSSTQFAALR